MSLWLRQRRSQFALLLLQRTVQTRDELEELPAEALGFGFPLQGVEPSLFLPGGRGRRRRRPPHVAACAGAAGQVRLGRGEELAGRPQALRPLLLLLLLLLLPVGAAAVRVQAALVALVQAGLVQRVVLGGGRAEEAGAAAGAAGAAQGSLHGRAGDAQAAVHARRLQGLVHGGVAQHDACREETKSKSQDGKLLGLVKPIRTADRSVNT